MRSVARVQLIDREVIFIRAKHDMDVSINALWRQGHCVLIGTCYQIDVAGIPRPVQGHDTARRIHGF